MKAFKVLQSNLLPCSKCQTSDLIRLCGLILIQTNLQCESLNNDIMNDEKHLLNKCQWYENKIISVLLTT